MIDYTKILITGIDVVRLSKILDFKLEVVENTGEISKPKKTIDYHFCKIIIYNNGLVLFTGSVHKLYNSINDIIAPNYKKESYKGYNGNTFTYKNIVQVKNHLVNLFDCKPHQMNFQNIEFGFNLGIDFNPQLFIKNLLYHTGKPFEFKFNQNFAQVVHDWYYIKIYNKSEQYNMPTDTIRFELKIRKSKEILKTGISTFADVTPTTLNKAKELILKRLDEVVYYDRTIQKNKLSKNQKESLKQYSNPRYWLQELKPNERHRHKRRLQQIIENNSENLKQKIRFKIIEKCSIIHSTFLGTNCSIIHSSNIELIKLQNTCRKNIEKTSKKKCVITGIDLCYECDI